MALNVLVACEESQRVCSEFRRLGHNAFSCDLQECSGGHPEWHIQEDVHEVMRVGYTTGYRNIPIEYYCLFRTQDGHLHEVTKGIDRYNVWDLIIAHPPCTYLAATGQKYTNIDKYGDYARTRLDEQQEAINFFLRFTSEFLHCNHVCIENPRGIMTQHYRPADQIIQPWQFGDPVSKETHLWLKNLPPLQLEVTQKPPLDEIEYTDKHGNIKRMSRLFYETRFLPAEERRRLRSKTFPGIARAMAEQWSAYLSSL